MHKHFSEKIKKSATEINRRNFLWNHVLVLEDCQKSYPHMQSIEQELSKFPDRQKILSKDHYFVEDLHEFDD